MAAIAEGVEDAAVAGACFAVFSDEVAVAVAFFAYFGDGSSRFFLLPWHGSVFNRLDWRASEVGRGGFATPDGQDSGDGWESKRNREEGEIDV